jgi:hypothetical protein
MAELDDWPILLQLFHPSGIGWVGVAALFVDYVASLR